MRSQYGWLLLALVAEAAVALAAARTTASLSGLLLLGPLLAAHRLSSRATAALTVPAVLLTLALPFPSPGGNGAFGPEHAVRVLVVVTCGGWAIVTAHASARTRRMLADMTHLAEVSQRALLRPLPSRLDGLGLAVHTRCAAAHARLGGDFHDALLTPTGPRLILGDVKGHGPDAIPLAAAVLAAFRHTAATAPDLVHLAHTLDARLRPELGPEDFVTLLLADFTPGEVRLVNCGHPPPLRAGRRLDLLTPPRPSPPLGLSPESQQQRVLLASDQRLLLYTDGLTEARDPHGVLFPLDQDVHAALTAPTLDQALGCLTDLLHQHSPQHATADDLTLLLVQPAPASSGDGSLRFGQPRAPRGVLNEEPRPYEEPRP